MPLPFSRDAFFEVFAGYNRVLWPVVLALWAAAAAVLTAVVIRPGSTRTGRSAAILLVGLWLWGGLVYHGLYFTAINPAAWVFAGLFVAEAGLLARSALLSGGLTFGSAAPHARVPGIALALYALAYPAVNVAAGHAYPATPTFGVPCPTTLFTIGLLLTCRRPPAAVVVIPIAWGLLAGSAASSLGVPADLALLVAAVWLGGRVVVEGVRPCWRWS